MLKLKYILNGSGSELAFSKKDQLILKLHNKGLSHKNVAKVLEDHGIYITRATVSRHLNEMRQNPNIEVKHNFNYSTSKEKSCSHCGCG